MPLCLLFCWILLIASCRSFASCYLIFSCIALLRNDLAVRLRPASSFPDISLGVCPPRRLRWQTTQKLARPTARLLARPPATAFGDTGERGRLRRWEGGSVRYSTWQLVTGSWPYTCSSCSYQLPPAAPLQCLAGQHGLASCGLAAYPPPHTGTAIEAAAQIKQPFK